MMQVVIQIVITIL